jgi:hypothetical protein
MKENERMDERVQSEPIIKDDPIVTNGMRFSPNIRSHEYECSVLENVTYWTSICDTDIVPGIHSTYL